MTDATPPIYEFGGFRLDVARRQLRSQDDQPASLTVKVFDLLLYLVEHRGKVVEKSALMQAVWPNVVVEENNLNQNVSVLRKVLGERAGEHRFIVTVPGRGFRFVAPVTVSSGNGAAAGAPNPAVHPVAAPRIAIMPFENLSPDPANAFFADGLHDEILATLAQRAPGLQVVSRTTMMRFRAHRAPLPQIATELNANYVVEGTVRREGDQVRMTVQLIDARKDRQLWSRSYERTLKSALNLQCEIASDVASRLAARFLDDTGTAPTHNPEAYDLYLRSRLLAQMLTPVSPAEQWEEPYALVSRAIELDPDFAIAYAHRAGFGDARFGLNYDNSEALVSRIRGDLAAAKRLAPRDPLVLAAEGGHLAWVERDLPRALERFQAAADAGLADSVFLSSYALTLQRVGRDAESHAILERAVALDPANPFLITASSLQLAVTLRPVEAARRAERGIAMYPNNPFLKLVRAHVEYICTGRVDALRRELAGVSGHVPPMFLLELKFLVLTQQRAFDECQALLDSIPESEVRAVPGPGGGGALFGVGKRPIAQFRGWLALMRGNTAEGARMGAEVLAFVGRQKASLQNDWFLQLLKADGYMLQGQREQCMTTVRAALEALPFARDSFGLFVVVASVFVLIRCGANDEVLPLLETLYEHRALHANTLYHPEVVAALAGTARYQSLKSRFESELPPSLVQKIRGGE